MDHGTSFNTDVASQGGGFGGGLGGGGFSNILPWLLLFGNRDGGGLFGGNNAEGTGTTAAINQTANIQFESLQNQINSLGDGIKTLAVDGRLDAIDSAIAASGAQNTAQHQLILQAGNRNTASLAASSAAQHNTLFAKIAECCCETQLGLERVQNNVNMQGAETRNLIQTTACNTDQLIINKFCDQTHELTTQATANTQRILDTLGAQELSRKDDIIAELRAQNDKHDQGNVVRQVMIDSFGRQSAPGTGAGA